MTAGRISLKSRSGDHSRQCAEDCRAVGAAMALVRRPFRVRHHAENTAVFRQDAGDVRNATRWGCPHR